MSVIDCMALSTTKAMMIIGIAGGSCSGKTSFAKFLQQRFPVNASTIITQDWYYIDQSEKFDADGGAINFDHPSSIDFKMMHEHLLKLRAGESIEAPMYDFVTHSRLPITQKIEPHKIIIVDGTLILAQELIVSLLDYSVYLDIDEKIRLTRRIDRDTKIRGRTHAGVLAQFENHVAPMHQQYVHPFKNIATHVITDEKDCAVVADILVKLMSTNSS